MGLLDELEQEAARRRGEGQQDTDAQNNREIYWQEKLLPALERLGEFLTKLAKTLNEAERKIKLVHPLAGYGDVVAYGEAPFECRVTPAPTQYEIEFSFFAQASQEESTLVVADTPGKVRLVNGLLQNVHLSGLHDINKNANGEVVSGRFQARGRIPVRLHVLGTKESGQAKMSFTNVEAFGVGQRVFNAETLTPEAFDALGRFLLRQNATLSTEKVGADIRKQLQSQVQRDQVRREWEAKLAIQLREDERRVVSLMAMSASPAALVGRLKLMFRHKAPVEK